MLAAAGIVGKSRKYDLCTMIDIMMTEIKIWSTSSHAMQTRHFSDSKGEKITRYNFMQIHEVVQSASNFKKLNLRSVKLQATFSCQHDDKKKSLTKNFNFKSGSAFMLNYLWCYLQCRKWCNLKPLYMVVKIPIVQKQLLHAFLENCATLQ